MKRTLTASLTLGLAGIALTIGNYNGVFHKTYNPGRSTTVGKANCLACHVKVSGGKLNPYGLDVQKAMKSVNTKTLTPEILRSIEKLDSNKNGKSNLEDIKSDVLPGG